MPELSIVIATFNAANTLPRTLASLAAQTNVDPDEVETLLIDGGSADATVDIARSFDCVTAVTSEPDAGIYDAMNKGARSASGTWIQFLNAGDGFTDPNSLRRILDGLHGARAAGRCWMVGGARNLQALQSEPIRIPSLPHRWWRHMLGLQPHCHQACWFDRSVFNAIGGHALKYSLVGDYDLILRFGILSPPHEVHEIVIDYLGGGISERNPRVPSQLQVVRVDRLGISPTASRAIGRAVGAANGLRHVAGRSRRAAFRALKRPAAGPL